VNTILDENNNRPILSNFGTQESNESSSEIIPSNQLSVHNIFVNSDQDDENHTANAPNIHSLYEQEAKKWERGFIFPKDKVNRDTKDRLKGAAVASERDKNHLIGVLYHEMRRMDM
jgi:hypothetical protein